VSEIYNIVIADDHPLLRSAIRQVISDGIPDVELFEASTLDETETLLCTDNQVDLLLLDIHMPGMHGLTGLCFLRAEFPSVPIAIISASTDPRLIRQAIAHGAAGYILKSSPVSEIREAINLLLLGEYWVPALENNKECELEDNDRAVRLSSLTPQQFRVLRMVSEGRLNKQIAYQLSISEATVKSHVSAILQKLEVNSRTQAVIVATRLAGDILVEEPI
jgi:DNA-binding NarL/FixJ family response regulator|tara:strand:- start:255 stop:914 length:660 start_codon:yes stop_codon:yes gene_type:complete